MGKKWKLSNRLERIQCSQKRQWKLKFVKTAQEVNEMVLGAEMRILASSTMNVLLSFDI